MGWYTLDSHSMTAKLVSHNEGKRLSEDAHESGLVKGQIISKELFVVLEFSQKMNEQICRNSENEFVYLFFGRIRGYQKAFRNYLTFRNYHETNVCIFPLILKILIHPFQKCGKNNVVTCVWLPVLNSY